MLRKMFFFAVFIFSTASLSSADVKFRLVTENFPPYNMSINEELYEHRSENVTGMSVEVIKELFRRADLDYSLKLRQWNYAFNFAQRKAFRGVFGTTYTEARKPLFKWVGPIATSGWVLFAKDDTDIVIDSMEDARKYLIGAYKGDSRANWLKHNGFNSSELDDDSLNPVRLSNGQIDLWISGPVSGPYYASRNDVKNIKPIFVMKETQLYLALSKQTPDEYVDKLNAELKAMREGKVIDKIKAKYQ